jgi:hypothetical protein
VERLNGQRRRTRWRWIMGRCVLREKRKKNANRINMIINRKKKKREEEKLSLLPKQPHNWW